MGKIGIVGSGLIGRSWAMLFASAGYKVVIYDIEASQITSALENVQSQLNELEKSGLLRGSQPAAEQFKLISGTNSLSDCVVDAKYVQECIPENLEKKRELFAELDRLASEKTILASSTSSMPASTFSENLAHRSQVIVAHPVNPPFYCPLTEVVPAPYTEQWVKDETVKILKEIGQTPVLLKKEIIGFALNRVQVALLSECCRLIQDDVICVEDLDKVMSDGLGMRYAFMGPLETCHLNAEERIEQLVGKQTLSKKRKLEKIHSSNQEKKRRKSVDDEEAVSEQEYAESHDEGTSLEQKSSEDVAVSVKRKHSRRKITDELKGKVDGPLCPSDLIGILQKHFDKELTKVELDDLSLDESHFAMCNDLSHNASSFMTTLIPKWKKMKREMKQVPGSPLLLVLCSSALRAVNFNRLIANFKGDNCKVGKLFAKHFKIEDQMKFLKTSVIQIGIGTANRIRQLLESGVLQLDQTKYIILDWSWRDTKQKRIIDIPEIRQDTVSLLSKFLIPHVKTGSTKLALL